MRGPYRQDLAHDLALPTLLFAVLGAMTWAVRGCAGAGRDECARRSGIEAGRRDWKNVNLIASVGLLTGVGWVACQNWRWAPSVWPGASFNARVA